MSELTTEDFSKRLKALHEALISIKDNKNSSDFLDSISKELSDLEEKIVVKSPSEPFVDDSKLQEQLDSFVRLYSEAYERTRKILYESQAKFDNVRLLSAEELKSIRDTYSEQLLLENQRSILLRKIIMILQQLLAKHKKNSEKNTSQNDFSVDDIEIVHFSVPIVASDKFRTIVFDEDTINRIRESILSRPEKIVMNNPQEVTNVNYVPGSAPEDMVDQNNMGENLSGVKDIVCFKKFSDELRANNIYNIIHSTSGRFIDIEKFLMRIARIRKNNNSHEDDIDNGLVDRHIK